jgi:hypothetical protein
MKSLRSSYLPGRSVRGFAQECKIGAGRRRPVERRSEFFNLDPLVVIAEYNLAAERGIVRRPDHESSALMIAAATFCLCLVLQAQVSATVPGPVDYAASLALGFEAFDQDPEAGWRPLHRSGKHLEAARLIDRYTQEHPELGECDLLVLRFHAAQGYAFANRYDLALKRLSKAEYPARVLVRASSEDRAMLQAWNAYVRATAAFLRHDRALLRQLREVIARAPPVNGKPMNLDIVDGLLRHFDAPYGVAYGSQMESP